MLDEHWQTTDPIWPPLKKTPPILALFFYTQNCYGGDCGAKMTATTSRFRTKIRRVRNSSLPFLMFDGLMARDFWCVLHACAHMRGLTTLRLSVCDGVFRRYIGLPTNQNLYSLCSTLRPMRNVSLEFLFCGKTNSDAG